MIVTPVNMASSSNPFTTPFSQPGSNAALISAFEQLNALNAQTQVFDQTSAQASTSPFEGADLVNLGPQALNILNGIEGANDNTSSAVPDLTDVSTPLLPDQQQQQIAAVLSDFIDAPFNQDTFTQIQTALISEGLSPDQITVQNIMLAFNPALALFFAQGTPSEQQQQRKSA